MVVRTMQPADLAAVYHIQTQAYVADMVEAPTLLASRLAAAPACAWVAELGNQVVAYLAAYPSRFGKISALGQEFQPAQPANALYLHDMAVAPEQAGQGLARAILASALEYAAAQGWQYACLVSVQSTRSYWQKLGFIAQTDLDEEQQAKLDSYVGPAFYMVRAL
ncbi:N-acetyltransferase [Undibacterium sp. YM2]|jgi:predicted N-acetyltransferase YhbS|uniref:GNAT family N-acetyltransferase n=1 Tax=Undibacterium sp. YM2 TaxID=2058625 RepID=UPI001331F0FF|nr:GNAT family N-acetyltransferase [Undibacterium sp. YM2]BBB64298.1 N-acetyltransferase [Undibacterium sp. YM2]